MNILCKNWGKASNIYKGHLFMRQRLKSFVRIDAKSTACVSECKCFGQIKFCKLAGPYFKLADGHFLW